MAGNSATIIAAPEELIASGLTIPQNHLDVCKAYPMLTSGNAAGNTQDPLNLNGSVTSFSSDEYGYVVSPLFSLRRWAWADVVSQGRLSANDAGQLPLEAQPDSS